MGSTIRISAVPPSPSASGASSLCSQGAGAVDLQAVCRDRAAQINGDPAYRQDGMSRTSDDHAPREGKRRKTKHEDAPVALAGVVPHVIHRDEAPKMVALGRALASAGNRSASHTEAKTEPRLASRAPVTVNKPRVAHVMGNARAKMAAQARTDKAPEAHPSAGHAESEGAARKRVASSSEALAVALHHQAPAHVMDGALPLQHKAPVLASWRTTLRGASRWTPHAPPIGSGTRVRYSFKTWASQPIVDLRFDARTDGVVTVLSGEKAVQADIQRRADRVVPEFPVQYRDAKDEGRHGARQDDASQDDEAEGQ